MKRVYKKFSSGAYTYHSEYVEGQEIPEDCIVGEITKEGYLNEVDVSNKK